MNRGIEQFRVIDIDTIEKLQKYWPFFRQGLKVLNQLMDSKVTETNMFRLLADIVTGQFEQQRAVVICDCHSQPLFYIIVFDDTSRYKDIKSMVIFAAYSNKKSRGVTRFGVDLIEKWAKGLGYSELHAYSARFSGAGFRLFEELFGFKRRSVLFFKNL